MPENTDNPKVPEADDPKVPDVYAEKVILQLVTLLEERDQLVLDVLERCAVPIVAMESVVTGLQSIRRAVRAAARDIAKLRAAAEQNQRTTAVVKKALIEKDVES